MNQEKESEKLSEDLIAKSDGMIQDAEMLIRESEDFYKDLGAEPGLADRFLKSEKIPEKEKEKIDRELEDFKNEVERDIRDEQDQFQSQHRSKAPGPKMKKGRVMI